MRSPLPDNAGNLPGRRLLRAAFWTAVVSVSVLAFAPLTGPETPDGFDKINHLLAFAALAWLAQAAYPRRPSAPIRWTLLLALGLLIETVQAFLPYRDFSLLDLAADGAGIVAAAAITTLVRARSGKTMAAETRRAQRED